MEEQQKTLKIKKNLAPKQERKSILLSPYSRGKKKAKFQDVLINTDKYVYILLNGKDKNNLDTQKGLNGLIRPFKLLEINEDIFSTQFKGGKWLLAIEKGNLKDDMLDHRKKSFIGKINANKTYLLVVNQIETFIEFTCILGGCHYAYEKNCFKMNNFKCCETDRKRHLKGRYGYA
ncbi:hypothetical protein [Priestia megaterium]|uniref:Uncharacterized protein n=1 Tax=Priestia megaterium TaxID=1404 RepID=A0A6M6DZS3_PRIMG|nr:hypothetical protein [Priestia megaterium]QJX80371.1 hypothetical protein FDZ14_30250 [Priestia megaterium]